MTIISPLSEIRKSRKKVGISQSKLALMVGISQSHLAKIELGKVDPSYSLVARILEALNSYDKDECWQYMTEEVMSVQRGERVEEIAEIMKRKGFSQVPVMDGGRPIGMLTEQRIIEKKRPYETLLVEEAVEDVVIVPKEASYNTVTKLVNQFQAVLVQEVGRIVGIITATDLIGHRAKLGRKYQGRPALRQDCD